MFVAGTNKEKFRIFLEVARSLNKHGITPVLFGSLGLYRAIGELERKINDVDFLVPDEFLGEKWAQFLEIVSGLGFVLKDEHEHEFTRNGEIVAFGKASELIKLVKVDFEGLKTTDEDGAKFKELSPEQYMNCYKFMLRDSYRQEKRGNADKEKIALIENYLQNIKRSTK